MNLEPLTTQEYCHKQLFLYCRMKKYSMENTYPVYRAILNQILTRFPEPKDVSLLAIQEFAVTFENPNTRKNVCVVIRWLFNTVFDRDIDWKTLPYPKKRKMVQPIYSKSDLLKVLGILKNGKQKAILALMIDCGLRISEPCDILIGDCNSKERRIILRNSKGDHDRIIYPSQYVWDLIKVYWNEWKKEATDKYLFDGIYKFSPYTVHSIRSFFKRYCKLAGVKYLGCHAIRRFTGTWWIENNVPLNVAAEKMGHSSSRTLEKYYLIHSPTYLKGVASPLTIATPPTTPQGRFPR